MGETQNRHVEQLWESVLGAVRPGAADVELWRCTLPRLDDRQLDDAVRLGWLTVDERTVAARRPDPRQRGRFGGRRILRRLIAATALGLSPAHSSVTARCVKCGGTGHGAPQVAPDDEGEWHMSTSSSDDYAVIALSRGAVGVDVESTERVESVPLARMAPGVPGWHRVSAACAPDATAAEVWAAVEALAKTTGRGLSATESELDRAAADHHLEWFRDRSGLVTCVATSISPADIATIDLQT